MTSFINEPLFSFLIFHIALPFSISDLTDKAKAGPYRTKASEYMGRAEVLAKQIESEKAAGKFHEQVRHH